MVLFKIRRSAWTQLPQHSLPNYANNVFNSMDGQLAYASLQPKVDVLQTKSVALTAALDNLPTGNHADVVAKDNAIKELLAAFNDLANGVEAAATTEMFVLRTGMELWKTPVSHLGELLPVTDLVAESNGLLGQVLLKFKCPTDQRQQVNTFAVEWSDDALVTWHNGTYENSERITVSGLPNRKDIYFRVRCIGTRGRSSQWSATVETFVL